MFSVTAKRKDTALYCSRMCRKNREIRTCRNCGDAFETLATGSRIYCSFACYRKSKAETRTEEMMRAILDAEQIAYRQEVKVGRYAVDFLVDGWLAVEMDGSYWHRNRDHTKKNALIAGAGWSLLRIPADQADEATRQLARTLLFHALRGGPL
jgi:very-short-patch-repair endonuclease